MRRSITIKDIARAARVAPSTVSRALHADPHISPQTTMLIRRLADEMGYTASLAARDLVTQKTRMIGLVISYPSDLFVGDIAIGVEEAARALGYSVFVISAYRDPKREEEAVQSLHERRTAGIIVTGSEINEGYLARRDRFSQPLVLVNCSAYPHSVSSDNVTGTRDAIRHLVQLGHRRIAHISHPKSFRASHDRAASYKAILAEHHVRPADELLVSGDGTPAGGKRAAQQLLALPQPPTAIFCHNDLTAIGVLCALNEAGLRVPSDCSVIGFDDLELAAYSCPPLTTVHQHRNELGQQAMHMLQDLIEGGGDVQPKRLPAELIVRRTTGLVR